MGPVIADIRSVSLRLSHQIPILLKLWWQCGEPGVLVLYPTSCNFIRRSQLLNMCIHLSPEVMGLEQERP